jgi:thymidylate synthase (FAD)
VIKVEYIDHMGNDLTAVNAARVSYKTESTEVVDRDERLINYLAKHKHLSPFEHCVLTVKITCPLYIRSQIQRHRTFAYNEISRRYTSKDIEFYSPLVFKSQHPNSKQCSGDSLVDSDQVEARMLIDRAHKLALDYYNALIDLGVSRETARGVLPQNTMTEFYMTGNLRNFCHFLDLRLKPNAQTEAREVAEKLKSIIVDKFGICAKALLEDV